MSAALPILQRPTACGACSLYETGRGFALDVGDPATAQITIMLETPAGEELNFSVMPPPAHLGTRQVLGTVKEAQEEALRRGVAYPDVPGPLRSRGVPVVGRTGAVLNRLLKQAGIVREHIFIGNSLRCVEERTRIWMADGSWKQIRHIEKGDTVKAQINGIVVNRNVIATTRTPNRKKWLQIDVDGAHKRTKKNNHGVTVTCDHEWITPKGRIRTDVLQVGDEVFLPQTGSHDVLFGSLQADGHVSREGAFCVTHVNYGWVAAKAALFGLTPKPVKMNTGTYPNAKPAWKFSCAIPLKWRNLFYEESGHRKWNEPTDKQLAIIYGDDGCIFKCNSAFGVKISRQSFLPQNADSLLTFFRSNFGSASINKHGEIVLSNGPAHKMFLRIAPWLHSSMDYKLPLEFRGLYNGWMENEIGTPLVGKVLNIRKPFAKQTNSRDERCLVVEEAHNFFTRCGLVSNCWPPKSKKGDNYPTGNDKNIAQATCRQYDRLGEGPGRFSPDVIVVSLHPASLFKEGASSGEPLILADLEKVACFARQGLRVLLLMGGHACEVFLGFGSNVSRFRGHYEWTSKEFYNWYESRISKLNAKAEKARRASMPKVAKAKKKTKAEVAREELATKIYDAVEQETEKLMEEKGLFGDTYIPASPEVRNRMIAVILAALTPAKKTKAVDGAVENALDSAPKAE